MSQDTYVSKNIPSSSEETKEKPTDESDEVTSVGKKIPIADTITVTESHTVLKYVDRGDKSKSKGAVLFLALNGLWLYLIYEIYIRKPSHFTSHITSFLQSTPYLKSYFIPGSTIDDTRMMAIGICSIVTCIRQLIWILGLMTYNLKIEPAFLVGIYYPLVHLIFTFSGVPVNTVPFGNWRDYVGLSMFFFGSFLETFSEIQRQIYKSKKEHKDKLYTSGLFSLARHINYTGEPLWNAGLFLLTTGNEWISLLLCVSMIHFFYTNASEELSQYLEQKYSQEWVEYTKKTPYKLIPGVC